jgi:hypothetical protein
MKIRNVSTDTANMTKIMFATRLTAKRSMA